MIKAAFFDLDDTLCDDTKAWLHCARAAASLGASRLPTINPEELAQAFLKISETYWMSLDYFDETCGPCLHFALPNFGRSSSTIGAPLAGGVAEEMASLYGKMRSTEISLFPDAMTTLATLREHGVKLACITNGLAVTHEEKVIHLGIDAAFDHVLIAGVIGHFKPDARIFQRALDLCECAASDAIMVGDNLTNDIGGAQMAGIRAYWFNPARQNPGEHDPTPDAEISTLSELIDRSELFK